ncbi:MAG: NADP-dependent oxidoreductase [Betaproteobacteria bacterium]|nr:NADP-dependent oxidoreductase [Betaproteobacteria bacterium]
MHNLQVVLASRPEGPVTEKNFRFVESVIPSPNEGEALVRNLYLSLDPYMRMRMNDGKSYAPPVQLGDVMVGGTIGEVVESKDPRFKKGDIVGGRLGWQLFATAQAQALRKIDTRGAPLSTALGVVGMPGVTAWYGLLRIGEPKPGETVVVSAASGAVGSVVGQIAKIKGCRTVGIAGGAVKCGYVVNELGFDACVDYKADAFESKLREATPDGIDIYFENVGGRVFDAVLPLFNAFARIPFCGYISEYDETGSYGVQHLRSLLLSRVRLQGFIISEHLDIWDEALADLLAWLIAGKLNYRETIVHGLERAPAAFIGMLKGLNLGKQLVKLA